MTDLYWLAIPNRMMCGVAAVKAFVPRRANLAFADWHKVLGDAKTTTAMPDRLNHRPLGNHIFE
jgi:prepilin-type processing-associated H-X9-DG protein